MNETQTLEKRTQTTVTKRPPQTLRQELEGPKFKEAVARVLPKHLTPDRFIRVALTAITRTPKLAQCEQASFFTALLNLSQLGLEPDGRRAHLIPFENRRRGCVECQLIVDYKGLAELAMRSGCLAQPPMAQIVCENDEFEWDKGQVTKHKVDWRKPRGEPYAVYAIAVTKDGGAISDTMTRDEVEAVRKRSRAGNNGPWVTDWAEMAKKTVFRRLSKWLPLSPEFRDALDKDGDDIEEKRIDSARQIFDAPEAFELPQLTAPEPDGDLANVETPPAPDAPKFPKKDAKPEPETELIKA